MRCVILLFVTVSACDFPVYNSVDPSKRNEVYVVRKVSVNKAFHNAFTLENINRSLHSVEVHTMSPWKRPDNFDTVQFSPFLQNSIMKYHDMKVEEILKKPETRMLYPFKSRPDRQRMTYNDASTTKSIIPPHIRKLHTCKHLRRVRKRFEREYFIGAKGQGANFHSHNEIFTHIASGKKLWMIADNFYDTGLRPNDLIAEKITELVINRKIKRCVTEQEDLIHIPKGSIHGTFNLETTLASGCIL